MSVEYHFKRPFTDRDTLTKDINVLDFIVVDHQEEWTRAQKEFPSALIKFRGPALKEDEPRPTYFQ